MTAGNGSNGDGSNGHGRPSKGRSDPRYTDPLRPLDDKRKRFVAEYCRGLRVAKAALAAGLGNGDMDQARARGSEVLSEPAVRAAVDAVLARERAQCEAVATARSISKAELVARLVPMVRVSMLDFLKHAPDGTLELDAKGAPQLDLKDLPAQCWEAVRKLTFDANGAPRIELYNRSQAAFDIAQIMGWIVQRANVRVVKSLRDLTTEELEDMVREAGALAPAVAESMFPDPPGRPN